MSGIAGLWNLDGRPTDPLRLGRMADAMAHRGPDGIECWIEGPVGLCHAMLHTTPESLREKQPLVHRESAVCLTLDGRVDNRSELRAALEGKGFAPCTDTDAELVLRAYECWGEECPLRILGDFAFALWDGRNQTLFCARDCLGIKPFYYYFDPRTFVFASELQQLFEGAAIPCEPNEGMIGEYLANAITHREETLYRGILRLPPAHCLRVQHGRMQKRRYWDIDPAHAIRYRTDAEYAEHFMEIFKEALRCRLRSHRGVGADLSGGLDSSSVVSVAQLVLREGTGPGRTMETFSLAFPGLPCDESRYIEDVVRKSGVKSNVLQPHEPGTDRHAEYVRRHRDFPGIPVDCMWESIRALVRQRGFPVYLTGLGGDDWLSGIDTFYVELLRRGRFGDLIRRVHADSATAGFAGVADALYIEVREDVLPSLPRWVLRASRWVLGRQGVPDWINPQFARRNHLKERLERKSDAHKFNSRAQRDLYRWLNSGYLVHSFEYDDRSASAAGFESRHPFHDRRIVEYAHAVPTEQLWRRNQSKFVLREATKEILPETVRQRGTKAEFSHAVARAFLSLGDESLLDSLAIEPLQWVNKDQVGLLYREWRQLHARDDPKHAEHLSLLWKIFGIDLWYKMNFLDRVSRPPDRARVEHSRMVLQ